MKRETVISRESFLGLLILLVYTINSWGQVNDKINPSLLNNKWDANWISYPDVSLTNYGVFHFRKKFSLPELPNEFIINVSGDNRYRLFINDTEVCKGPARGDLANWRFETIDIAKYLKRGENILAAVVWNFGEFKPLAQVSLKAAFIVQGNGQTEKIINTDNNWKVYKNEAYSVPVNSSLHTTVGEGEVVNSSFYPYGWKSLDFNDEEWKTPIIIGNGIPNGKSTYWDWSLIPRNIPFMEYKFQRINEIERTENIVVNNDFIKGGAPINIPPNKKVKILFDQTYLTTAYPEIVVSGGKGSIIEISYAEALVDDKGIKGNRNQTEGKTMLSYYSDIFKPDGESNRQYQPLWFRTYRYLELNIETKDQPLVINDLYGYFRAYPFEEKAIFKSSDKTLQSIWEVGWRTARLCAGETYYDCPYYEQLQYVGDTRIQALISLNVANDDRLMRNAIEHFHNSMLPIGITQSRYPCSQPQIIPTFSLLWIEMVHDFWMYRDDQIFVKNYLNGIRNILHWYEQQIDETGMLGSMDWWNFVDWSLRPWNKEKPIGGTPDGAIDGNSSIITLQYVHALQMASELFEAFGKQYQALEYKKQAESLRESTYKLCWDDAKGLLSDTPKKDSFSQHANVYYILTEKLNTSQNKNILRKILTDEDLTEATFYFKFYLVQAINKVGLDEDYFNILESWKDMIDMGLTTFAETSEPTRSDCHAWSASPNYHFLSYVCGINPASPRFKTVIVKPHLGKLDFIDVTMPHYMGEIIVSLKKIGNKGIEGKISLPKGLSGKFVWKGKEMMLKEGSQEIKL